MQDEEEDKKGAKGAAEAAEAAKALAVVAEAAGVQADVFHAEHSSRDALFRELMKNDAIGRGKFPFSPRFCKTFDLVSIANQTSIVAIGTCGGTRRNMQ